MEPENGERAREVRIQTVTSVRDHRKASSCQEQCKEGMHTTSPQRSQEGSSESDLLPATMCRTSQASKNRDTRPSPTAQRSSHPQKAEGTAGTRKSCESGTLGATMHPVASDQIGACRWKEVASFSDFEIRFRK